MSYDNHIMNPRSASDYGPPVRTQLRLTGTSQTGRLVIVGNPISYVVEPGRYYPFLSLRGHNDPASNAIREQIEIQKRLGIPFPSNQEPRYAAVGYNGSLAVSSTAGAVQTPPRRLMPNTTIGGIGPEGTPPPYAPLPSGFFGGIPHRNPGRL